jgi:peptidoglycan/xylan/chitin deacetylase (PgdA/CDA1 family)/SAM-dependent methyltransferase
MTGTAVVAVCCNLGRYIADALDSVRMQTRPATEIVIVDDGSDDRYTQQVLSTLRKDGTFVVRTENRGVAAARNLGVGLTSSPYVVLLDADDALAPTFVERLGGVLDVREDLDFVTCGLQAFGDADYLWTAPPCTVVSTLTRGGPHVSTMFRRRVWDLVGGFDGDLPGYEDTDFWLRALECGCRGDVIPEPLLRYRVRAGSRYAQVVSSSSYLPTMQRLYGKHWPALAESDRVSLLIEKDRFLVEQRSHSDYLRRRQSELEHALTGLNHEIVKAALDVADAGTEAVEWGDLRRPMPLAEAPGVDRGLPIERHYVERFLERHQTDIRDRVLEVRDSTYTRSYGGGRVVRGDVVDIDSEGSLVTITAGQADCASLDNQFDCFIMVQALHMIYDVKSAIDSACRVLKPGGVLLCTIPCVSRMSRDAEGAAQDDYWRMTPAAARELFAEVFPIDAFEVTSAGNVMACAVLLRGLAAHELSPADLAATDPWFPLLCCVRAVKPAAAGARTTTDTNKARPAPPAASRAAVLLYHRVGAFGGDTHRLSIDPADFRSHMLHLREHYEVMALDAMWEALAASSLPPRTVVVTFDDGYVDNLTIVAPILVELGIPATFFVNTGRLAERHEHWWDVLERVTTSRKPLPPELDVYGDGRCIRPTSTSSDREALHRILVEAMYPVSSDDRTRLLERVIDWSGLDLPPRDTHRAMIAGEIRRLSALPGMTVGAHSVNHLNLPAQPGDIQRQEVSECKEHLEQLLNVPVTAFAYPYGEFSRETLAIVSDAGYRLAVIVDDRPVRPGAGPLLVPRCEIGSCNREGFAGQLTRLFSEGRFQVAGP